MSPSAEANFLSWILAQPGFPGDEEACLYHFCRLKQIAAPWRARGIFDVLVATGVAKDFADARNLVKKYLIDYLQLPL